MSHYDCKECHRDPVSGHTPDCTRGKVLSSRLAEAAIHAAQLAILYQRGEANYDADALRSFSELKAAAADEIASARIKGDKDRENPDNRPHEIERLRTVLRRIADAAYVDHQSGNENFQYLQTVAEDALQVHADQGETQPYE